MSKAVLVIDMPENCAACRFLNDNYDYPECIVTNETRGYNFRIHEQKMDKCPLRNLPRKSYEGFLGEWSKGYQVGWNKCIDKISGDEKDV